MPRIGHRFLSKSKPAMPEARLFVAPVEMKTNPFLKWAVSTRGMPPILSDWESWLQTHRILERRVSAAMHRLGEESSVWSDYESLSLELFRWNVFRAYGQFWASSLDSAGKTCLEGAVADFLRWDESKNKSPAFHRLKQWVRPGYRGISAAEKERVRNDLSGWGGDDGNTEELRQKYHSEEERLLRRISSTQERARASSPGVLAEKKGTLQGMFAVHMERARRAAASRGEEGWLFRPDADESLQAAFYAGSEGLRRELWEQKNGLVFRIDQNYPQLISNLLECRGNIARTNSSSSYSHHQMSGRAESSLKKMESFLLRGLKNIRPVARRARAAFEEEVKNRFGVASIEPWNEKFFTRWYNRQHSPLKKIRSYFPWEKTLLKALPDLVRAGGWAVERCTRNESNGPVYYVTLRHQTGYRGHLIISLFDRENVGGGPEALPIRVGWGTGATMEPIASVHCAFDEELGGFAIEELDTLAHEVGHALHYLSITPATPELDERAFPWDVVEVPSILLASMAADPHQVHKWSSGLRKTGSWLSSRLFKYDPLEILNQQEVLFQAWADLKLHQLKNIPDIRAWANEERKKLGLPGWHEEDNSIYCWSCWEGYSAGSYAYPWADAVVEYLLCQDEGGAPSAAKAQEVFYQLQECVLRRVGSMDFNVVWKHWRGETIWECANRGLDRFIKSLASSVPDMKPQPVKRKKKKLAA